MASSTLDPDNIPEPDRQLGQGHGTDALGPSDISDTGSDVAGGLRAVEDLDIGLDKGTNEDPDFRNIEVRGDSDSVGTGEHAAAGRDSVDVGADIGVDRVDHIASDDNLEAGADDSNGPTDLDVPDPGIAIPPARHGHPSSQHGR